jgi:hypothetical protein
MDRTGDTFACWAKRNTCWVILDFVPTQETAVVRDEYTVRSNNHLNAVIQEEAAIDRNSTRHVEGDIDEDDPLGGSDNESLADQFNVPGCGGLNELIVLDPHDTLVEPVQCNQREKKLPVLETKLEQLISIDDHGDQHLSIAQVARVEPVTTDHSFARTARVIKVQRARYPGPEIERFGIGLTHRGIGKKTTPLCSMVMVAEQRDLISSVPLNAGPALHVIVLVEWEAADNAPKPATLPHSALDVSGNGATRILVHMPR